MEDEDPGLVIAGFGGLREADEVEPDFEDEEGLCVPENPPDFCGVERTGPRGFGTIFFTREMSGLACS